MDQGAPPARNGPAAGGARAPSSPGQRAEHDFDTRETNCQEPAYSASDPRLAPSPWPLNCPATTTHVKRAYGVPTGSSKLAT